MFGTRVTRLAAALSVPVILLGFLRPVGADEPEGTVRLGGTDCPCPPSAPYMLPYGTAPQYLAPPYAPSYPPYMMPPAQPSRPAPMTPDRPTPQTPSQQTPSSPQSPQQQPAPQQPQTPQQQQSPQQQQATPPAQATPTFTPSPSTAATSPQATAPNTIGDFFGPLTIKPIILPGEVVNQAIFVAPINTPTPTPPKGTPSPPSPSLSDYFRIVTPTGVGTYSTASDVLLGEGKSGIESASLSLLGEQLLIQYDGSNFTGNLDDLGDVTDPGPFIALDSGTVGDVTLLSPEDPNGMTVLMNETIYDIHDAIRVFVPTPGAAVGRQKIVENNSIFPRDRVFLNYSAFTDVPLSETGENVHRFVPGFEMAFFQEQMSVEVRLPFASTLDSTIRAGGLTNRSEVEFGNMVTTLKALVARTDNSALAVGASLAFPTAPDVTVYDFFGNQIISMENTSLHVLPYIGAARYEGRWFAQGYVQGDIDTSGNRVLTIDQTGTSLEDAGDLNESALLYVSASVGYWIYQNGYTHTSFPCEDGRYVKRRVSSHDTWLTGFAPIAELHYNRSLETGDVVRTDTFEICNADNFSLTNLVLGGLMTFGSGGSVSVAWSTPIIGRDDRLFESEVRVWLDWTL